MHGMQHNTHTQHSCTQGPHVHNTLHKAALTTDPIAYIYTVNMLSNMTEATTLVATNRHTSQLQHNRTK